ncbi:RAD55 family ATPase [Halolamina salifodinae]|uniref:KaiC/GvpD/RAD55 family RecA-like ATPase n=1 Tax=Halolamina salifodinae TaxID=1202767 RepID=A0A8T4GYN0_9EURY|nr:transcriptional regulator [Halolamina salifodinae]MBP1986475.1 KaiC/GvpD/RAD55 family RecA-like ATPase [Halolamina salifodinae]
MAKRLSTGISILDREIEGGVPAGSMVLLSAEPASQSELFLYELTAARPSLYLTTVRSDQSVEDAIAAANTRTGSPTVRDVGGDAPLDRANRLIGTLPEEATLIVDVVDALERYDRSRYRRFLNELQTVMVNTGGIAILHGLKGQNIPANRDLTAHVADVVFDLRTKITNAEVENRLVVPKFRGGKALSEPIKLRLAESVNIDTSRDIA